MRTGKNEIKIENVVLVKENNMPPSHWFLGSIRWFNKSSHCSDESA